MSNEDRTRKTHTHIHFMAQSLNVKRMFPPLIWLNFYFRLDTPSFSISREPGFGYPIIEGTAVSLKCEIEANPYSEPKWLRDQDKAHNKAESLPSEQLETNPDGTVNFTSITISDSGWYRCTTQHALGFYSSFGYFLNVRSE